MTLRWPELGSQLAGIEERLARIEQKLDEQKSGSDWHDPKSAAVYLRTTVGAIRAHERAGRLPGYRDPAGRIRFKRADLDSFATSDG